MSKKGRMEAFLQVFDIEKYILKHPGCSWMRLENLILEQCYLSHSLSHVSVAKRPRSCRRTSVYV